jgi:hypothetical protein
VFCGAWAFENNDKTIKEKRNNVFYVLVFDAAYAEAIILHIGQELRR